MFLSPPVPGFVPAIFVHERAKKCVVVEPFRLRLAEGIEIRLLLFLPLFEVDKADEAVDKLLRHELEYLGQKRLSGTQQTHNILITCTDK